jgi:CPA1 family monovalent cation:H+ antiporter
VLSGFDTVTLVTGVVALLLVVGAVRVVTDRLQFPYAVALVIVGLAIGEVARRVAPDTAAIATTPIAANMILFVLIPTLIFEAAFHTNVRLLRQNLGPVLTLAVPAAVLSSFLVATIVWLASPFDFAACLLLGAILSSTDPVAVVAIFRKIGAPARLTMLVEGESLLNDATAILLARIMLGVIAVGAFGASNVVDGLVEFDMVFFGGAIIGWIAAVAIGWLISKVHDDPFTATALTSILAYASFLVAERGLHLSGVVAVVVAGLVMADWGRTKMSPHDEKHVEHLWHFAGNAANAMLFLLVGFSVEIADLWANLTLFGGVIMALLVSRAVAVFGLAPLMARLPNTPPISFAYQTVVYWGGLRGGIAIAIVLGLSEYPFGETFVALVMGSVLFTLVMQGMTMERLVRWLGLDKPALADRVAKAESQLDALRAASASIPELRAGGLFSQRIGDDLDRQLAADIGRVGAELEILRHTELNAEQEKRLLLARCFSAEQALYHGLFRRGHLSEGTYRDLATAISMQADAARDGTAAQARGENRSTRRRLLQRLLPLAPHAMADRLRQSHIAEDYERAWGEFQATSHILKDIDRLALAHSTPADIVAQVRTLYLDWQANARQQLDVTAEQFPEFVTAQQERLAQRLISLAQSENIEEKAEAGAVPPGIADDLIRTLTVEHRALRGGVVAPLHIGPAELLRKVPSFKDMPEADFAKIASVLVQRSVPAGQVIVA